MPKTAQGTTIMVTQPEMQRVEVEWEDSLGLSTWMTLDAADRELAQVEKMRHATMGYVVKHTHEYIAVAQSRSKERLSELVERGHKVNDILQIPLGCVKSITRLRKDS